MTTTRRTMTRRVAKKTKKRPAAAVVLSPPRPPYTLPPREWDRGTELVRMFAATGFVANAQPQSLLLISEPGSGKTELIERFSGNSVLSYASDITSQGLYPLLKLAKQNACTHLMATEFQKFLLRKSATAQATLGILCQAMEEGVGHVRIGEKHVDFGGAQIGLIGAITHDTAAKWHKQLRELGFWSRCAAFEWEMPLPELRAVMRSISRQDRSDLSQITFARTLARVHVEFPESLSEQLEDFVFRSFKNLTILRVFQRFRTLSMACAVLDGRTTVCAYDVEKVVAFLPYWLKMVA